MAQVLVDLLGAGVYAAEASLLGAGWDLVDHLGVAAGLMAHRHHPLPRSALHSKKEIVQKSDSWQQCWDGMSIIWPRLDFEVILGSFG